MSAIGIAVDTQPGLQSIHYFFGFVFRSTNPYQVSRPIGGPLSIT